MLMRMPIFIFTILFLFTYANLGVADSSSKDEEGKMTFSNYELDRWAAAAENLSERYEDIIRNIRSGKVRLDNKMTRLRAYYPYTSYYDPFSKKLIDEMTLYAYTVDTSEDRVEVNKALDSFRELVYKHIAHLGVVSYAYTLSSLDPRLGDENFFKEARDLIRSSWGGMQGIGLTPEHPYKVITYEEENYILETYGGKVEKSEIFEVSEQFYDVRDIVTEEGKNLQIFFDVTEPIIAVNMRRALAEKETKTFIPLQ